MNLIDFFAYPLALRFALVVVIISSVAVTLSAILSAKSLGGRLGLGLKKIAAGSIMHAELFIMLMMFDRGWDTILTPSHLRLFVTTVAIAGSVLLIAGFIQIYKVSKELKLFY